jgi:hypothetical protein
MKNKKGQMKELTKNMNHEQKEKYKEELKNSGKRPLHFTRENVEAI